MSTGKEEFFNLVREGREGKNIGLSVGSKKLENFIDGYLPGTSYLIGAISGVGKSTYTLWAFIYQPLIHYLKGEYLERDPRWLLFSLEMTRSQVYAKLVSMYIMDNFGVELRYKQIFSRGKDCILTDEEYKLLEQSSSFIDILDERLTFYEGSLTEAVYLKEVEKELRKYGKFEDNKYIPNNPQQILGVLVDHFTLVKASAGRTKKDEIDAISRDSVMLRNKTGIMSPIHIAQFNRDSANQERMKQGLQDPSSNDFKDSGSLYEDSQIVLALFSPHKYKLASYRKYDIKTLEQCFIGLFLLKSRFGTSDIMIPMCYYGDSSHYIELPKSDEIFDYEKYKSIEWAYNQDNIEIEDNNIKQSKFVL